MKRQDIFDSIERERKLQDTFWGREFDKRNTPNDWTNYIIRYVAEGAYDGRTKVYTKDRFREFLLKAAALIVAALEQEDFAPRHYDRREEHE